MSQFLILLVLTIVILMQTVPAYSGTMTFQISAIMPEHVMANNIGVNVFSNNPNQLVQTQMVIRGNRSIRLTSIVVP